jgi:hypothetical protein
MRFQEQKTRTHAAEYAEFLRLDSFFTNPGSRVVISPSGEDEARRRYDQLHNLFYAK